jgi:hypothetical protein
VDTLQSGAIVTLTLHIYAFVVGHNGHLYVNYWDGSAWHWADQGTPQGTDLTFGFTDGVIAYSTPGGERIYAFASDLNQALFVNYWDGSAWHWADQQRP